MEKREINKLMKEFGVNKIHYIDYCPNCGEKVNDEMISFKNLKKIIKKLRKNGK